MYCAGRLSFGASAAVVRLVSAQQGDQCKQQAASRVLAQEHLHNPAEPVRELVTLTCAYHVDRMEANAACVYYTACRVCWELRQTSHRPTWRCASY